MPQILSQDLLGGRLCLQLLPRAAYSARDPAQWQSLGLTLERQRGVHAIDSDHRVDFDTLPGVLAFTPVGVEVFSESASGGEYLLLRVHEPLANLHLPVVDHRVQSHGNRQALMLGHEMRRLLLDPQVDVMALEQCALALVGLEQSSVHTPPSAVSTAFCAVLEQIAEQFHEPLTLEQLAQTYGHNELRLLRDFTRATGLTPHAYLVQTRLRAARRLIEVTDRPLSDIALDAGFSHQSHMGSAFRKHLGMTPSQYRARIG
ncbi:helix-turn-helix domain-containing protein [Pseudomonas sp. NPDC089569]|uniref:helix-turn-helix domain-containing protein n=1 Tax=Pseudomonas sp. NPDC089569 TaxID=3390722 RepID=UPI003D05D591